VTVASLSISRSWKGERGPSLLTTSILSQFRESFDHKVKLHLRVQCAPNHFALLYLLFSTKTPLIVQKFEAAHFLYPVKYLSFVTVCPVCLTASVTFATGLIHSRAKVVRLKVGVTLCLSVIFTHSTTALHHLFFDLLELVFIGSTSHSAELLEQPPLLYKS
jgi:hypothetical protein